VAEALGWHWAETDFGLEGLFPPEGDIRYNTALYGALRFDKDGYLDTMPKYSTSWNGMGVLVEEAWKQEIYLDLLPQTNMYICEAKTITNFTVGSARDKEAPYAACLSFLEAKGIAI